MSNEEGLNQPEVKETQDRGLSDGTIVGNNDSGVIEAVSDVQSDIIGQIHEDVNESDLCNENGVDDTIKCSDIISEIQSIKDSITSAQISNEKFMMRKDAIEALKKTFEDALLYQDLNNRRPLVRFVATMYERYEKLCKVTLEQQSQLSVEDVLQSFGNFIVEIENLLISLGVDQYDDSGKILDPSRHDVAKVIETNDPSLDKIIAEGIGYGYVGDGISIKQKVSVYKYREEN